MILVVKSKNYTRIFLKTFSYFSLMFMLYLYYEHMNNKFDTEKTKLVNQLNKKVKIDKLSLSKRLEKLIYVEAEKITNLLGQENIQTIKLIDDKLYIVCDFDTNIEPLLVRYGVKAMLRQTQKNIKIAIDLNFIVENRYEI